MAAAGAAGSLRNTQGIGTRQHAPRFNFAFILLESSYLRRIGEHDNLLPSSSWYLPPKSLRIDFVSSMACDSVDAFDACLHTLLSECHVLPRGPADDEWIFRNEPRNLDVDVSSQLRGPLAYLANMKHQWNTTSIELPDAWLHDDICEDRNFNNKQIGRPNRILSILLEPVLDSITRIPSSEIYDRALRTPEVAPDFCLTVPRARPEECLRNDEFMDLAQSAHCQMVLSTFLNYSGTASSAEFCISNMFTGVPGCWMRRDPTSAFPVVLDPGSRAGTPLDFALLLHQYGSSHPTLVERDLFLRVSTTHPALVLAVKGPVPWIDDHSPQLPGRTMDTILQDLAFHAQPNVDVLLAALHLRRQQNSLRSKENPDLGLPDFAFIIGLVFDAEAVSIVAHIPVVPDPSPDAPAASLGKFGPRYISLTVDILPFTGRPGPGTTVQEWITQRLRVAVALLVVQRHAHRLSAIWQDIVLPEAIRDGEDALESSYLGECPLRSVSVAAQDLERTALDIDQEVCEDWETDSGAEEEDEVDDDVTEAYLDVIRARVEKWLSSITLSTEIEWDWQDVATYSCKTISEVVFDGVAAYDYRAHNITENISLVHSSVRESACTSRLTDLPLHMRYSNWSFELYVSPHHRSSVGGAVASMYRMFRNGNVLTLPESWVSSDGATFPRSNIAWYEPQRRALRLMLQGALCIYGVHPVPDSEFPKHGSYPTPDIHLNPHQAADDPHSLHAVLSIDERYAMRLFPYERLLGNTRCHPLESIWPRIDFTHYRHCHGYFRT
ncbi:hypothetical protein PLICRDRAFT_385255 [Plicaturopsis crispa FD-325 SS-3]|nr:hypothetical protein PLICRDRAFT_385255 [Plicaturopsis crispa FD-325 SS-3]